MHHCDAICGWTRSQSKLARIYANNAQPHLVLYFSCTGSTTHAPHRSSKSAGPRPAAISAAVRSAVPSARRAASAPIKRLGPPRRARRVRKGCVLLAGGATSQPCKLLGARAAQDHGRRAGSTGAGAHDLHESRWLRVTDQVSQVRGVRLTTTRQGLYTPEPKNIKIGQTITTFTTSRRQRTVEKQSSPSATDAEARRLFYVPQAGQVV